MLALMASLFLCDCVVFLFLIKKLVETEQNMSELPFDTWAFFAYLVGTMAAFAVGTAVIESKRFRDPTLDRSEAMETALCSAGGVMVLFLFSTLFIWHQTKRVHPISGIAVGAGLSFLMIHFGLAQNAKDRQTLQKAMIGWSVTAGVLVLVAFVLTNSAYQKYEQFTASHDSTFNLFVSPADTPVEASRFFTSPA